MNNPLYGPQAVPGARAGEPMPGLPKPMPRAHWSSGGSFKWETIAPDFEAFWSSPIFDLRPEFRVKDDRLSSAVPVNRSNHPSKSAYLRVILFGGSAASDPAIIGGLRVFSWEAANDQPPRRPATGNVSPLFAVSKPLDITKAVTGGGLTGAVGGTTYQGGSLLYFSIPAEGVRFWQVNLRLTFTGADPVPLGFGWQASVY